ncbi:hypothetical protein REPUB_Repub04eG0177600 [Reevesia pubescens]
MRGFEKTVEWLRPFVDSKAWDFCVVWKLGDDPSKFIEWKDCCCSGAAINVKVEKDELQQQQLFSQCRDAHFQHSIRSKACEALSHFPFVISLYAGIHGEVAMSNQPKWINHANISGSHSSHETMGTQVLIPVFGGLIELFASKHISKDQNIIELVTTQCNALLEPEVKTAESCAKANLDKWYLNTLLEKDSHSLPFSLSLSTSIPRIHSIPPVSDSSSHLSLEGLSNGSSPSIEHPPFASGSAYISQDEQLKHLIGTYYGTKRLRCSENVSEQQAGFVLDRKNKSVTDKKSTTKQPAKESYHSKNLVTERNRRKKIKDGLFKLRALVPKISKMDIAAIFTDAIEYIGDLQEEEKKLQNELRKIEEEDCGNSNAELKSAKLDRLHKDASAVEQNQASSNLVEMEKMEVHVEVNQITKREFLIKLYYEHKRGGFAKLMEGIDSLGLRVIDANVTTFNGKVLNIFKVEVRLSGWLSTCPLISMEIEC